MALNYKGIRPSILVMSATPIPRTLTLAAYGDMDESRLIEKPIGRKPIKTSVLTLKKEKNLIERIKNKINNSNDKFFWVCPLIEESQELDLKAATDRYNLLNKLFLIDPEYFNSLEGDDKIKLGYDVPHLFAVINGLTPTQGEIDLKNSKNYPYTVFV